MKNELIFFRLLILIVFGSSIGFGSAWAYKTKKANDWQSLVSFSSEQMNQSTTKCVEDGRRAESCELYTIWEKSFNDAVVRRNQSKNLAKLFALLAYGLPALAIILFYSLRWAFTGRIRPIIVRNTELITKNRMD